jgi:response regulator of citrate/malate metabolism
VQEHYNADSAEYEQIAIDRVLAIEASHDRINDAIEGLARAERELAHAVFAARNNGCTWQSIGDDLGVSRSAAHQRFGSTFDTPED